MAKITDLRYDMRAATNLTLEMEITKEEFQDFLVLLDRFEKGREISTSSTPSVEKPKKTQEIIDDVFNKELEKDKAESNGADEDDVKKEDMTEREAVILDIIHEGKRQVKVIHKDLVSHGLDITYSQVRESLKSLKKMGKIRMEGMRATSKYYIVDEELPENEKVGQKEPSAGQKAQESEQKDGSSEQSMKKPTVIDKVITPEIRSALEMIGTRMKRRWKYSSIEGEYRMKWDEIKEVCNEVNLDYNDLVEHIQAQDSEYLDIQKHMNLSIYADEDNGKPTIVITGKFR
jgi:hypothetical protein